jgi:AcrR family transcriptional regulator
MAAMVDMRGITSTTDRDLIFTNARSYFEGMSKGEATRERILGRAFLLAGRDGLDGLTIGALADELKLSKSGLFAHFGSKEELQVAVLDLASSRFTEQVMLPAFKSARGLPRLERIFENWVDWMVDAHKPGGCIFTQAIAELDDQQGRPHDVLLESQLNLVEALTKTVQLAVDEGHFGKTTDPKQFAFELHGIMMTLHMYQRLFKDRRAVERARSAFKRLVQFHSP